MRLVMLAADDSRWSTIKGEYRLPFDPRTLVKKLERQPDAKAVWEELRRNCACHVFCRQNNSHGF